MISSSIKANISQEKFNQLIDQVVDPYREVILNHYGAKKFVVNRLWEDPKVNASARKKDGIFSLKIYGGLARFKDLTPDAFTLVICHELGHLIGGAPTWKPFNISSSEGQADYFSTLKCFRRINLGKNIEISQKTIHPIALEKCKIAFSQKEELDICLRSSKAQESLAKTITYLANLDEVPKFDTPDPYERMFTIFNGYPNPQCRLDTMLAGSVCVNNIYETHDMGLYNKGNCSVPGGDAQGLRPKCWYVERED